MSQTGKDFTNRCRCLGCSTTAVIYTLGTCLCWVYAKALFPESGAAAAAAIIVTLPVFTVIGSIICAFFVEPEQVARCGYYLLVLTLFVSIFFDVIGVILLIASLVHASRDLESPAGPIVCGSFATFFVLVSAISHFSTWCNMAKGKINEESNESLL